MKINLSPQYTSNSSYVKKQPIPINIKLDNSIYNGTIIDGIFIKHDKKREKFYVITDLYLFRGVSTEKDKINMKYTIEVDGKGAEAFIHKLTQ